MITRKPYFETALGKLYCGDCLDIMKEMEDKSVDLVLTDPPYGFERFKGDEKDYLEVISSSFIEWPRILKGKGCAFVFSNTRDIVKIANCVPLQFRRMLWMYKPADCTFPFDDGWLLTSEAILYFSKNGKPNLEKIDKYHHDCYLQTRVGKEGVDGHPTVKPLMVVKKLAMRIPKDGLCLDPFLGSGTTAVACEQLGRRWIGIEISEKYCEIAARRIKNEAAQGKMFV